MKMLTLALGPAFALALSLSVGTGFAQTAAQPPQPSTTTATPQMAPTAKPKAHAAMPAMSTDKKMAISKACSAAADKEGLKGKPRKKFRESCISKGGPTG